MATIMSHNLPLIPLPLKASLAKTGLMMSGLLGKEVLYGNGPTERSSPASEARSSPESVMMNQTKEDDRMSCCSEDSELSVGQEVGLDESDKTMNGDENRSVASSRISGLDVEKLIDRHSVEVSEEVSNDSSRYSSSKEPSEDYMKIPVMRPSPTRLHEEFLRNSQLYAEELMRQQMQIVAAARGLNLSPKPLDPTLGLVSRLQDNRSPSKPIFTEEQKLGFRPHIRSVGDLYPDPNRWSDERSVRSPPESSSFRGIHSHLSAISQITQNLNSDISKLTSPSSLTSMTSRESSQSPPNQQAQLLQLNNNIALNDQNLKFSIDNILKADFGRRITDPLKRSGKSFAKKPTAEKSATSAAAMDLTSVMTSAAGCSGNSSGPSRSFNSSSSSASGSEVDVPASPQSSTGSTKTGGETSATASGSSGGSGGPMVWPAWVYCTRYSDRPSSEVSVSSTFSVNPEPREAGSAARSPRTRKPKKSPSEKAAAAAAATAAAGAASASSAAGAIADDKRPRTAFSGPQLARLKHEFAENRYLTERRRQQLSAELGLNEAQIKIWFQNKRAKIKKSSGTKNPLALQLMAQGLYNHSTVPLTREEEELQEMQAAAAAAAESRIGSSD